jgi:RNA polymerase sigma-70 factor (ECF subfamily)
MSNLVSPLPDSLRPSGADEELLFRYRDCGDVAAFEELVARYEKPLFNYLYRYLHDAALAEDVFQTTFLRVHQKADQFMPDGRFRPWLYSIATHLAVDAIRREGRQKATSLSQITAVDDGDMGTLLDLVSGDAPSPMEQMETKERAQWARAAVGELPEDLRAILLLAYFQGLKFHEVAEILQLPLGTVKSRLHRALVMLNQAWRRKHGADSDHRAT